MLLGIGEDIAPLDTRPGTDELARQIVFVKWIHRSSLELKQLFSRLVQKNAFEDIAVNSQLGYKQQRRISQPLRTDDDEPSTSAQAIVR